MIFDRFDFNMETSFSIVSKDSPEISFPDLETKSRSESSFKLPIQTRHGFLRFMTCTNTGL